MSDRVLMHVATPVVIDADPPSVEEERTLLRNTVRGIQGSPRGQGAASACSWLLNTISPARIGVVHDAAVDQPRVYIDFLFQLRRDR